MLMSQCGHSHVTKTVTACFVVLRQLHSICRSVPRFVFQSLVTYPQLDVGEREGNKKWRGDEEREGREEGSGKGRDRGMVGGERETEEGTG